MKKIITAEEQFVKEMENCHGGTINDYQFTNGRFGGFRNYGDKEDCVAVFIHEDDHDDFTCVIYPPLDELKEDLEWKEEMLTYFIGEVDHDAQELADLVNWLFGNKDKCVLHDCPNLIHFVSEQYAIDTTDYDDIEEELEKDLHEENIQEVTTRCFDILYAHCDDSREAFSMCREWANEFSKNYDYNDLVDDDYLEAIGDFCSKKLHDFTKNGTSKEVSERVVFLQMADEQYIKDLATTIDVARKQLVAYCTAQTMAGGQIPKDLKGWDQDFFQGLSSCTNDNLFAVGEQDGIIGLLSGPIYENVYKFCDSFDSLQTEELLYIATMLCK